MIQTACPNCNRSLVYEDQHAGLQGQCDGCGALVNIPNVRPGGAPPSGGNALDSLASLSSSQAGQNYQGGYQGGYQPGYQGGYQGGGYQTPYGRPQGQSHFGMAIAGFILAFLFSLVGLILCAIALNGMKKSRNMEGHGLALAGLIISIVSIALGCIWFVLALSLFAHARHI